MKFFLNFQTADETKNGKTKNLKVTNMKGIY